MFDELWMYEGCWCVYVVFVRECFEEVKGGGLG